MQGKVQKGQEEAGAEGESLQQVKKLLRKIRKFHKKQSEQIKQIKRQSVRKYFGEFYRVQAIINGTQKTSLNFVAQDGQMVIASDDNQKTQPSVSEIINVKNQGIKNYWRQVIECEYHNLLRQPDLRILENLQEIQVCQYTHETISVNFKFRSGFPASQKEANKSASSNSKQESEGKQESADQENEKEEEQDSDFHGAIKQGAYRRTLTKDSTGVAVCYHGPPVPEYNLIPPGFMKTILNSETDIKYLFCLEQFFELLVSQLIPRSIKYYLRNRSRSICFQKSVSSPPIEDNDIFVVPQK